MMRYADDDAAWCRTRSAGQRCPPASMARNASGVVHCRADAIVAKMLLRLARGADGAQQVRAIMDAQPIRQRAQRAGHAAVVIGIFHHRHHHALVRQAQARGESCRRCR